jgi:hypothetical protein
VFVPWGPLLPTQAEQINNAKLRQIAGTSHVLLARDDVGDDPWAKKLLNSSCRAPERLELKIGVGSRPHGRLRHRLGVVMPWCGGASVWWCHVVVVPRCGGGASLWWCLIVVVRHCGGAALLRLSLGPSSSTAFATFLAVF